MIKTILNILLITPLLFILISAIFIDTEPSIQKNEYTAPVSQNTLTFMQEFNPELIRKIESIKNELKECDDKIEQLELLKEFHPNQKEIIDKPIQQWSELHKSLYTVYNSIYVQIEKTYLTYEINKIEGYENFESESQKLINQANTVLEKSQNTKSIIERSLYNE